MPQLILEPWFFIFMSSWLIFIIITPKKILSHTTMNNPTTKTNKTMHQNWTWPWL